MEDDKLYISHILDAIKEYSGIPWKEIVGMRDNLIHEYFDVAWDIVWSTVKKDLPLLKDQLQDVSKRSHLL